MLKSRLQKTENRLPKKLIILADVNGVQIEMTIDEFCATNAGFCRVLRGNSLNDLDRILNIILGEI